MLNNNDETNTNIHSDISSWDVSRVKNMAYMFAYSHFNDDISRWNVESVENMKEMFANSQFNQDISDWNVSNVEKMKNIFYSCSRFEYDLSDWKISKVMDMTSHDMYNMFLSCMQITNKDLFPKWAHE